MKATISERKTTLVKMSLTESENMKLKFTKKMFQIVLAVAFTTGLIIAQNTNEFDLSKGEVIERVKAKSDEMQSYALYLPKNYTPEKKWAILYAFEPIARGKLPVMIYQEAAEKYGFIVVGSYNSQNGLDGQKLAQVLNTLWTDTHQRFSIDENRVYATGFSCGARVASIFAASCGCATGVIGSGAGFSSNLKPSPDLPFIYYSAIGFDDYNYYEIRALKKLLEKANVTHRVERFDGVHQWLTKPVAENALAWMQLYAMKKGVLPKDEKFIDDTFQARIIRAESYFTNQQFLEAFQDFSDIVRDYSGLKDIEELEKRVENLKKSKELKKSFQAEEDQISHQERHANFLMTGLNRMQNADDKVSVLQEMRAYISRLQKIADGKEDSSERRIARRSLNKVFAETYETALFRYEREKKYDLALLNFEMANEIYPKNFRIPYDRARVYALSGNKKKALEFLAKAIELGFKNFQEVENEKGFEKIVQDEKFQQILSQIKNIKTK